jgi:Terminase large subunit, T4likevirus-type, N-terminal
MPDPWQRRALRSQSQRLQLLCSRQSGKSTVTACIALHTACYQSDSLVLLVSRSERQSGELFLKVSDAYKATRPIEPVRELAFSLELANGSRILALPGDAANLRCYSGVRLVVVDEAALVLDPLFTAVLPMLAVSRGRLIMLSTPYGRRGFFFERWETAEPGWERITARATECPRIDPEFLSEQRRVMGPRLFGQEFECDFVEAIDQVFSSESIDAMFHDDGFEDSLPALMGV